MVNFSRQRVAKKGFEVRFKISGKSRLLLVFLLLVPGSVAFAADQDRPWKIKDFPGIPATEFTVSDEHKIDLFLNKSSAVFYKKLNKEEKSAVGLSWQWKVDQSIPVTGMAEKGDDDRPVAVHIWFTDKKSGGLKRFLGRLAGYEIPGQLLTYVWGGHGKKGTIIENPHFRGKGYYIILRSGSFVGSDWQNETIDFRKDYEKIFGDVAPLPSHIAVSGDSDDTKSVGRASVRELEFIYKQCDASC